MTTNHNGIYITCNNENTTARVQRMLFKHGIYWVMSGDKVEEKNLKFVIYKTNSVKNNDVANKIYTSEGNMCTLKVTGDDLATIIDWINSEYVPDEIVIREGQVYENTATRSKYKLLRCNDTTDKFMVYDESTYMLYLNCHYTKSHIKEYVSRGVWKLI